MDHWRCPKVMLDWASNFFYDYWEKSAKKVFKNNSQSVKWSAPPPGMLAVNVDATMCKNAGVCSSGVVIRDHEGKVLVSKGVFVEKPLLPLTAELLAIKERIILIKERELWNCIVLSDCCLAVSMLNCPPKKKW
ncbi:hypothetical protein POM88_028648 [Heracleum sosnowskyi]|uniref:RNase H type-1 domain-containing protein n=1 Tax=Heracleum sosnowskyi TaxID=360622 RepID=A0AAD8HSG3_9APIA|nr:hypothetical protein POM88_028648 [Heracleum sosnowskyi]